MVTKAALIDWVSARRTETGPGVELPSLPGVHEPTSLRSQRFWNELWGKERTLPFTMVFSERP